MKIEVKKIETALNPFELYTVFRNYENTFLLDSSRDFNSLGRYSFIGINPIFILYGNDDGYFENQVFKSGSCIKRVEQLLLDNKISIKHELPFIGGCIGFISYDETSVLPKFYFNFYDNLITRDNLSGETFITSCGILSTIGSSEIEKEIIKYESNISNNLDEFIPKVNLPFVDPFKNMNSNSLPSENTDSYNIDTLSISEDINDKFISNFNQEDYVKTVGIIKEYIRSGDIYITNLTRRIETTTNKDGYDIYKKLREINPAPFAAYLKTKEFEIISSSPERFLRIQDRMVETRPIKGTRPRGKTPLEDEKNKLELLNSEKDKAELLMIVDLERNDLSKVCKPNTVHVPELFKLEEYSTVFHLVSTVTGKLKDNETSVSAMQTCFPGGSITGTPKLRSMEIIEELERSGRGLYTGCIGYFSYDGNADFNIVIRTIIKNGETVAFGVGGGITIDSNEEEEYFETIDKAVALMKAIS
jgi:para-aminobenzoate synthetase component 1